MKEETQEQQLIKPGAWTMHFTLHTMIPNHKAKSPYELMTDKEKKALEISWLLFGK